MKNQYFGDINDFRKYGLLRKLLQITDLKLFVAWYLTDKDSTNDGNRREYLNQAHIYKNYDSYLFTWLKKLFSSKHNSGDVGVHLIEKTNIIKSSVFYSEFVQDNKDLRNKWFDRLCQSSKSSSFVFLDPDNGLPVKSVPFGRKKSSKYVYWHEIQTLWELGKSLLIYQHFPRIERKVYIETRCNELSEYCNGAQILPLITSDVVFLLILQPVNLS